jgi:hypothetical protein
MELSSTWCKAAVVPPLYTESLAESEIVQRQHRGKGIYRLCTPAAPCGGTHVLMDPLDFMNCMLQESKCPTLLAVHEVPTQCAPRGCGFRFVFDIDGGVLADVEGVLSRFAEEAALAVACVLQGCAELRCEASASSEPLYEDLVSLIESAVFSRDWDKLNGELSPKMSAHIVVTGPCLIDRIAPNKAAAVILAGRMLRHGTSAMVDLAVYGSDTVYAQLRAVGIGPKDPLHEKSALLPYGQWRQESGWSRTTTTDAALCKGIWCINLHTGCPVASSMSERATSALVASRRALEQSDYPASLLGVDTLLVRYTERNTCLFRETKGLSARVRQSMDKITGCLIRAIKRLHPGWKGLHPRCVKLQWTSPTAFQVFVTSDAGYCGIKGESHQNKACTDKASFTLACGDGRNLAELRYSCKHSSCVGRTCVYPVDADEYDCITAIQQGMWPAVPEFRRGCVDNRLAVVVISPWAKPVTANAPYSKTSRVFFVDYDMTRDHKLHPSRARATTAQLGEAGAKWKQVAKYNPVAIRVVVVGAELVSLLHCRAILADIAHIERSTGATVTMHALIGPRALRLTGQVGRPFVDLCEEGRVPTRFEPDSLVWDRAQLPNHVSMPTHWTSAQGRCVQLRVCTAAEVGSQISPTGESVARVAVRERNLHTPPLCFFSFWSVDQCSGRKTGILPRVCGGPGWCLGQTGSCGYGSDTFKVASYTPACATHVAESVCYPPGNSVPFRVLYTNFPVNFAEVDTLVNDLPDAEGCVVYLVAGTPKAIVSVPNQPMIMQSSMGAVPFYPDLGAKLVRPVKLPTSMPYTKDRPVEDESAAWSKMIDSLRTRMPTAKPGDSKLRLASEVICRQMLRFGTVAYRVLESPGLVSTCAADGKGMFQLVTCPQTDVGSNKRHVKQSGASEVVMASLAYDVATSTQEMLRVRCTSIHYVHDHWGRALELMHRFTSNKSDR